MTVAAPLAFTLARATAGADVSPARHAHVALYTTNTAGGARHLLRNFLNRWIFRRGGLHAGRPTAKTRQNTGPAPCATTRWEIAYTPAGAIQGSFLTISLLVPGDIRLIIDEGRLIIQWVCPWRSRGPI